MPRFCGSCGTQMADTATACPKCGAALGQAVGGGAAAAPAPVAPAAQATGGIQDNVAGLLAYLFIPAIIFLVMEPYNKNKFVRFHSWQSLVLGIVSIVGHIFLTLIPIIGWILLPFFSLGIFILAVIAAIKALQNQEWKIPGVGGFAEKQANAM